MWIMLNKSSPLIIVKGLYFYYDNSQFYPQQFSKYFQDEFKLFWWTVGWGSCSACWLEKMWLLMGSRLCTVNKEPHGRRKQTWRYCRSLCPELLMSPDRGPGPRTKHRSPSWRTSLCRNRFEHNGRSAFCAVTMCHKHCHLRGPSSHYHIIICSRPISP